MHRLLAIFAGYFEITIAYRWELLCYQAARTEVAFKGWEEVRLLHDVDDEVPQVELALGAGFLHVTGVWVVQIIPNNPIPTCALSSRCLRPESISLEHTMWVQSVSCSSSATISPLRKKFIFPSSCNKSEVLVTIFSFLEALSLDRISISNCLLPAL